MHQPTAARGFPALLSLLRVFVLALTVVSASLSFAQADQSPSSVPTLEQRGRQMVEMKDGTKMSLEEVRKGGNQVADNIASDNDYTLLMKYTLDFSNYEQQKLKNDIRARKKMDAELDGEVVSKKQMDAELDGEVVSLDESIGQKKEKVVSLNESILDKIKALNQGKKIDATLRLIASPEWGLLSKREKQEIGKTLRDLASDANWQARSRPDIVQSVLKQARTILGENPP